MPKKIKKPAFLPCEKRYRISTIVTLGTSMLFSVLLGGLMNMLLKKESILAGIIIFAGYILFLAAGAVSLTLGVRCYIKEDNTAVLGQSAFFLAQVIICLMNLRFALVLLFSALNLDSAASALKGSASYTEFVQSQYTNWVCLAAAMLLMIVTGIFGMARLIKVKNS